MPMRVRVGMRMVRVVAVFVRVIVRMFVQYYVNIVSLVFCGEHPHSCRTDSASVYFLNFDLSLEPKASDSLPKERNIHSGMEQRTEHHVAANSGKAIEICNSHRFVPSLAQFISLSRGFRLRATYSSNQSDIPRDRAPQTGSPLSSHRGRSGKPRHREKLPPSLRAQSRSAQSHRDGAP